jgi:Spirocyclase AveC-like
MGCAIFARVAPRLRNRRLGWIAVFGANALLAAVCELVFVQTGAIANVRTASALTLWAGHSDQWPLYNPILFGAVWTVIGMLRYSAREDGRTFADRGLGQLPVGGAATAALRFLAISAFLQLVYVGLYFVPWNLLTLDHGAAEAPVVLPALTRARRGGVPRAASRTGGTLSAA